MERNGYIWDTVWRENRQDLLMDWIWVIKIKGWLFGFLLNQLSEMVIPLTKKGKTGRKNMLEG